MSAASRATGTNHSDRNSPLSFRERPHSGQQQQPTYPLPAGSLPTPGPMSHELGADPVERLKLARQCLALAEAAREHQPSSFADRERYLLGALEAADQSPSVGALSLRLGGEAAACSATALSELAVLSISRGDKPQAALSILARAGACEMPSLTSRTLSPFAPFSPPKSSHPSHPSH